MNISKFAGALLVALGVSFLATAPNFAQDGDSLATGFQTPPNAARPRVWWHWMSGNVSQEGITKDLEWMQRIGIGGVQNFDASLGTPTLVAKPLAFMSAPWQDALRFAVRKADALGLEFSIAGSPGWSESGGPWVTPQQGMKKLVWSEIVVAGGKDFNGKLPQPPVNFGLFQDQSMPVDIVPGPPGPADSGFYRDVRVIAFPLPAIESAPRATLSASAPGIDAALLVDGHLDKSFTLPRATSDPAWLRWDYGKPQTIRALTIGFDGTARHEFQVDPARIVATLQASDDGTSFRDLLVLHESIAGQRTLSFAPVTARYFRLLLPQPPQAAGLPIPGAPLPTLQSARVSEARLLAAPRVNRAEEKGGFFIGTDLMAAATPAAPAAEVIPGDKVLDITANLHADGTLHWRAPQGRWAVLRLGYSLLGTLNHPASSEGTGLEVDKLSRTHVRAYLAKYLSLYDGALGPELVGARGLRGMINDSYEAGSQNWTEEMPREFEARRGYGLLRWLPALTGRIVDDAAASDAFLWDYRRTLGEMFVDNHYGEIAAVLKQRGLTHYVESHESQRAFVGDGMEVKRLADVPMSATWVADGGPVLKYDADVRESASVAHLYGQNLVAAESLTTIGPAFGYAPADLKSTADRMLSNGLNRFVIHTSVHQPLDRPGPGITLGPFGQYFTRHETWAEQAKPWIDYLARSSFLLQQGRYVADVLYYYGEDTNITLLYADALPAIPAGFAYDFANPQVLAMLRVENGELATASGMRYRVLMLDPSVRMMSLDVLRHIAALVTAGATLAGSPPVGSPSLRDDKAAFAKLVQEVWGDGTTTHAYGKGSVLAAGTPAEVLRRLDVQPDFAQLGAAPDAQLAYVHRRTPTEDLYFVSNRKARPESLEVGFRVAGKSAELWYADTGRRIPASYRSEAGRTIVPLELAANDAVFVVFREPAQSAQRQIAAPVRTPVATLDGRWKLAVPGATAIELQQLAAWNTRAELAVKYFSGTAAYSRDFEVQRAWTRAGARVQLDLGVVRNLAEVLVNGRSLGVLWKAPFSVDVTDALRRGVNTLEVRVTNLWPNRLIGDKQPGVTPVAFTTFDPYPPNAPLLESGLLGPVRLTSVSR